MVQKNVDLKPFHTFGLHCNAAGFAAFNTLDELTELLEQREHYENLLILGGGSNILPATRFNGLVLHNQLGGIEHVSSTEEEIYVKAAAGVVWHELVLHALDHELGGLENLSLIPGSVGASPMQNIGAYGQEIKDVFHELEAWHITDKALVKFNVDDCRFGYRESVFKNIYKEQFVILSVTFKLSKQHKLNTSYGAIENELLKSGILHPTIRDVSNAVIRIRQSKLPDPNKIGNAGSFFKNPEIEAEAFAMLQNEFPGIIGFPVEGGRIKLAAGWLIEQCGWKGYRLGDAGVHEKQALVLVNYGNATGEEIIDLSKKIIASVQEKFGVELQREVNLVR